MNQESATPKLSASLSSKISPASAIQPAEEAPRCQHRTPSGRQCRAASSTENSLLCARHSALQEIDKQRHSASLAAALTGGLHGGEAADGKAAFPSAEGINQSLVELFKLLAEDRISPRRAAVLAYIGSLLLRSHSAIQKEQAAAAVAKQKTPIRIVWDLLDPPQEGQEGEQTS